MALREVIVRDLLACHGGTQFDVVRPQPLRFPAGRDAIFRRIVQEMSADEGISKLWRWPAKGPTRSFRQERVVHYLSVELKRGGPFFCTVIAPPSVGGAKSKLEVISLDQFAQHEMRAHMHAYALYLMLMSSQFGSLKDGPGI